MTVGDVISKFKEQFPGLKIEALRPYKDGLYFWIDSSPTNIVAKYIQETDTFSLYTTRNDWEIK